jgi:hypothetical protein
MGIKKDAFFRDVVRTRLAFEKDWKALYFNELQPAYTQAGGNPERAVQLVVSEPAKYPILNSPPLLKEDLAEIVRLAESLSSHAQPPAGSIEDILREQRAKQPAISRQADSQANGSFAEKFFMVLKTKQKTIDSILTAFDRSAISKIIETASHSELVEKLADIFKKAWIRSYFDNFDRIKSRIEALPIKVASKNASVYRVVFAYLDSLDRGL